MPNRIYRHSTVYRCPTGSTGTQQFTDAQQDLQALNSLQVLNRIYDAQHSTDAQHDLQAFNSLQVPNRIYRHSTGRISVQNAVLSVLQFRQFARNLILSRYFRTTMTCSKERKTSYECQIPLATFLGHVVIQEFLSENALKCAQIFVSNGLVQFCGVKQTFQLSSCCPVDLTAALCKQRCANSIRRYTDSHRHTQTQRCSWAWNGSQRNEKLWIRNW